MDTYNIDKENISTVSHSLKEKEYWRNALSGGIEKVSFPHDLGGGANDISNYKFDIEDEVFNRILSLSKESIPMIYMILVSNLKALLFKCLGENDIVIGSPVEKQKDNKNLINTILPLRSKISNDLCYKQLLLQVRKTIIEAIDNQNYPFETMKNDLKTGYGSNSFNPLFDIAIYMSNLHEKSYLEGSESSMIFGFNKCDDKIEANIDYNSSLYKKETIERIAKLYVQLIKQLLFNLDKQFNEVSLVSTEEYNSLIFDWNNTASTYSIKKSILDVFEEQVQKNGNEIALSEDGNTLTFNELDKQVNKFANSLKKSKLEKGTVVGILLDRSTDFIVSTFAVLKTECTFLPIDIGSNEDRINFILDDSGCELLITNKVFYNNTNFEGNQILFDSKNFESFEISAPVRSYNENETAYIIYTSGTTGKPKGTYVLHRGLINYILWASETYVKGEKLSFPLFTSVAFDLTITSIFTPLASGGTLYIYNSNETGNLIDEIVKENKVNVIKLTPSHLKLIRNYKFDENPNKKSILKRFIVGGEQLETDISNEIFDNFQGEVEIFNEYGPTEATVGSMIYKFDKKDKGIAVPIGKPIANTQIYLLNRFLEPVPQGFQGEIFIAGSGLAGGYHKKPELTASKFMDNPFVSGDKMYKTGDLGRINEDSNLEFIGRKDQQVKIRGFRVELGEIENKIQTHLKENFSESPISPEDYLQLNIEEQKRCSKCLLPENYENITIGSDGVCSLCNEFESYKEKAFDYFKTLDDLETLIQNSRKTSKSKYDCLLLFSGGKDSTYVLHRLVKMGLKILTFTYDNGYISKQAFENIDKITKKYNVDSLIIESDNMKEVLCESLKSDHNVCNGCFKGVNTVGAKIANDYGINVVFTGLSRGQIFEIKLQGLFKLGIRDSDEIDEQLKIFRREYHSMNTKTSRLLNIKFEDSELDNIRFVDYFRYDDIKTRDVLNYLIKVDKSWDKPADTGTSSSNCMINDVGIYVHYKDKGYHFYADQSSWDCRLETISREEGIDELKGFTPNYNKIGEVLNELGYYESSTSAIVVDKTDSAGDKVLCAYFVADKKVEISSLHKSIAAQLPDYMVPSYFMQIDKIPLTLSGKVNKDLLPEPKIVIDTQYAAPTTPTQKKVTEIWSDVLDINMEDIGIHNNFFELGGHSLKATLLISEIEKILTVKIPLIKIFENPTIEELSLFIDNHVKSIYSSLKKAEPKEYYNVSSAQKRIHFVQQFNEISTTYNKTTLIKIEGNLNIEKFQFAFKNLIQRHESYRTSFHMINGIPVQKIHENVELDIKQIELNEKDLDQFILKFRKPYNLEQAPLIRIALVKISLNNYYLVLDINHIITDGSSIRVFVKDLLEFYKGNTLEPLKLQYKDFSEWQNNLLRNGSIKKQEEFWLNKLSGELPRLELESDNIRPKVFNFKGRRISSKINYENSEGLYALAKENEVTIYMIFMSILNVLFYKYTMQKDILIGSTNMGRTHSDLSSIVGIFINKLLIRTQINPENTFFQLLQDVKSNSMEAHENQDIQFEFLVDQLNLNRDPSRTPLVGIDLVVQNFIPPKIELEDITFNILPVKDVNSKADLTFFVIEENNSIELYLEYYKPVYKKETAEKLLQGIKTIIDQVLQKKDILISDIDILTKANYNNIVNDYNNTYIETSKNKTIIDLFEEKVNKIPDAHALICDNKKITYNELNKKANQLANLLINSGIKSEEIVAIMAERSFEMVVAILAVLKSGGVFLPIESNYPLERKKFMLENSKAKLLLTQDSDVKSMQNLISTIDLDDQSNFQGDTNNPQINNKNKLAYVIYTSGSSGRPKGVMIEHKSLVNYCEWANNTYVNKETISIPLYTSISFDLTITSIFVPLIGGNTIIIYKDDESHLAIEKVLKDNKVDLIKATPSHLKIIKDSKHLIQNGSKIKKFIIGGENLSTDLAKEITNLFGAKVKIYNEYGPSEATVGCMVHEFDFQDDNEISVALGKPIANTQIYLLDNDLKLVPDGVNGEICIAGDGLARGYLFNSDLTNEKFIKNPFNEGSKLYKTGDIARRLHNGKIIFISRKDQQIKIRGNRVELQEIETILNELDSIKEAKVLLKGKGKDEKYLCAYVVLNQDISTEQIKSAISKKIPDFMIPAFIEILEKLPMTVNGKIDIEKLSIPNFGSPGIVTKPTNPIEVKLAEIWSEVLDIELDFIDIEQSFFDLGGHSIKAMELNSLIYNAFEVNLPISAIFTNQSIKLQSIYISKMKGLKLFKISKAPEKEAYETTLAQQSIFNHQKVDLQSTIYNMPIVVELIGEIDIIKIEEAINWLVARNASFRTSIKIVNNKLMQIVSKEQKIKVEIIDNNDGNYENIIKDFVKTFDLQKSPLLRCGVVNVDVNKKLIILDSHHIISDGISQRMMIDDIIAYVNNNKNIEDHLQYIDYSEWQNSVEGKKEIKRQSQYWLETFNNGIPALNIPTDNNRTLMQNFKGDKLTFSISKNQSDRIKAICKQESITEFMFFISIYSILLNKIINRNNDIIIGVGTSGRIHPDLQNVYGMFVNTLPFCLNIKSDITFNEFIKEIKEKSLLLLDNQESRIEDLVMNNDLVKIEQDKPLFEAAFVWQNFGKNIEKIRLSDQSEIKINKIKNRNNTSKFTISLYGQEIKDEFVLSFEYATKLFNEETIVGFRDIFLNIINGVINDSHILIREIDILSKEINSKIMEMEESNIMEDIDFTF